ncbi:MAG: hypothetical protein E2O82_03665 [Betaproteobacteria bacterium]|nr:MAG: hypothetical protein E2O82_03665 [Betaproteobacteria bacterium]
MAVNEIQKIEDHYAQAIARLPQIMKDAPKTIDVSWSPEPVSGWEALIHAFTLEAQDMENTMIDMLNGRSLDTAEGVNLDRIGQIVGADRGGATDEEYLVLILAQIAANNSDGTADNILGIFRVLAGPNVPVRFDEQFPAKFYLEFQGQGSPVSDPNEMTPVIKAAKVAGVGFEGYVWSPELEVFAFDSDPSPDARPFEILLPIPAYYDYEFPDPGETGIFTARIQVLNSGTDIVFQFFNTVANGPNMDAELKNYFNGSIPGAAWSYVAKNGSVIRVSCSLACTYLYTVDASKSRSQVTIPFDDDDTSVKLNGIEQDKQTFAQQGVLWWYTDTEKAIWESENPDGILKTGGSYVDRGVGGHYSLSIEPNE